MKRFFFLTAFITTALFTGAQAKCTIKKAYAYFTVSTPGMQIVDENGNPIPPVQQIERYIYLEVKGNARPQIVSALYNDSLLVAGTAELSGNTASPGKDIEHEKEIILRAGKGNKIWKIALSPANTVDQIAPGRKQIILKIKLTGKIYTCKITAGEIQLYSLPRY